MKSTALIFVLTFIAVIGIFAIFVGRVRRYRHAAQEERGKELSSPLQVEHQDHPYPVFAGQAERLRFFRSAEERAQGKRLPSPLQMAAATMIYLILAGIIGMILVPPTLHNRDLDQQRLDALPHTVHCLGYAVTFPKKPPEGHRGGKINYPAVSDDGKQEKTEIAEWRIYSDSLSHSITGWPPFNSPYEGGIDFMVNEHAASWFVPYCWQSMNFHSIINWKEIVRTSIGTKEVAGLKFTVIRWTAKVSYEVASMGDGRARDVSQILYFIVNIGNKNRFPHLEWFKISGVEYVAQDHGNLIKIRGYNCGDEQATILLTESVLNSLHRVKPPYQFSTEQ